MKKGSWAPPGFEHLQQDASTSEKTEFNRFGLPYGWAREESAQALERMRVALISSPSRPIDEIFEETYAGAYSNFKKLKSTASVFMHTELRVPDMDPAAMAEQRRYFSMSIDEKVAYLNQRYPEGLLVVVPGGTTRHMKWEMIVPSELWAVTNHGGQTLIGRHGRGGYSPREIVAILEGVNGSPAVGTFPASLTDASLMTKLEEKGYLKD